MSVSKIVAIQRKTFCNASRKDKILAAFYSESTGAISWDGSNDAVSEAALSVRTVPMMHRPHCCHHNHKISQV